MSDQPPELAVIVLALNAPPTLRSAVHSLLDQSIPLEIAVVNSGGGEPDVPPARDGHRITVVSVPQRLWPGAARNLGIGATEAPWIAFLASDLLAQPGWAENRLKSHKQGRNSVASAVTNSHPHNLYAWANHLSVFGRRLPRTPRKFALRYGASYSRLLFARHGLFREDLRIGEDTEFHRRLPRPDRPAWTRSVRATHLNPTTFRGMLRDQLARGRREGRYWPPPQDGGMLRRCCKRFALAAAPSIRSVRGWERLFVVASWPLLFVCSVARELGLAEGRKEHLAASSAEQSAVVAILDRDEWDANTDIIVVADASARRLTWIPRDLWVTSLRDRVNTAFASHGGKRLLLALMDLGFPARNLLCLRRGASEAALGVLSVTVPVSERLEFWYPLHPTRPIEEGRKAISFDPPQEILSGERLHQWIGARTMMNGAGSDLYRLQRQQTLLCALLAGGTDFSSVLKNPQGVHTEGDPLKILSQITPDWEMVTFDRVTDAVIDGKSVLKPLLPGFVAR